METATKNLEHDHEHILRLIEIMERMTKSDKVDIRHCELVVEIIRNYADGLHHAKEEEILFSLLSKRGIPVQGGPIGVMLVEHELGRSFVRGMADNIIKYKAGEIEEMTEIFSNMLGYAELLRNHINKENTILYRIANQVFTEEDKQSLIEQFNRIEFENEKGKIGDFISKIDNLDVAYP